MYNGPYPFLRKIRWWLVGATVVAFPIALLVVMFSSCDVRMRSEKRACRNGDVARCLEVGEFYEAKADGILGFLMSHADTAIANYYRACKLKSAHGCERMVYVLDHGEQAKNLSTAETDMADALTDACIARASDATCEQLFAFMDRGDWVGVRTANAFQQRCTTEPYACFLLARMHVLERGGKHKVLEQVLPLYEKACTGGVTESCKLAQAWRDEQARRAGSAAPR